MTAVAEMQLRPSSDLRHPSGERQPRDSYWKRWVWGLVAVLLVGGGLRVLMHTTGVIETVDQAIVSWFADHRTPAFDGAARGLHVLAGAAIVLALRWAAVTVLLVRRHFRRALVLIGAFAVCDVIVSWVLFESLPRPEDAPVIATASYSFPSRPIAALAVTLYAIAFAFVPRGPRRTRSYTGIASFLLLMALINVYLGVDYLVGTVFAINLACVVAGALFAVFAPHRGIAGANDRARPARDRDRHRNDERRSRIVEAMARQLAVTVTTVEPYDVGLSRASSVRMTLADGGVLFGRVFPSERGRARRWRRLGHEILYGQLDDELSFSSARRLATYEDYASRLLADNGVRVPSTYGVVELVPDREYMLVTEYLADAQNLTEAAVDVHAVDEGLRLVRALWDVGVAHGGIGPRALTMYRGHMYLVDASTLHVRPTGGLRAVDLANMMLTLALRSDPVLVYSRATRLFTPDEIADAFASTQDLTMPRELRVPLAGDQRDLLGRFRHLAPDGRRLPLSGWTARRIAMLTGAWLAASAVVRLFVAVLHSGLT
jgi:hypothetical protein